MLRLEHIYKRYQYRKVLDDINIDLPSQGLVGIVGPSGCGKSTLMHIIGGLDREFQGQLYYRGHSVKHRLYTYRKKHISFIFQNIHLIMWLSVRQNKRISQFFNLYIENKNIPNIQDFDEQQIYTLSLGQRQKLSYLRAYYHQHDILLCDEPTGSLDEKNSQEVMSLLKEESKICLVIVVSHDQELVNEYCDEIYKMKDGRIVEHCQKNNVEPIQSDKVVKKHMCLPCLRLSICSILSHKKRFLQLVIGLTLSLVCILLTLTMSSNLEKKVTDYIYSLLPASGISFQSQQGKTNQTDLQQFTQLTDIIRGQLYWDDIECLGIGFHGDKFQENQTLFIGDDTLPYQYLNLKLGDYPKEKHEIVLSYSTAQHLCENKNIQLLIGKTLYAWYRHEKQIKPIKYHIVGISQQSTLMDTIYTYENGTDELLKDVFSLSDSQMKSSMGILYIEHGKQREKVIQELKKLNSNYKYLEIGKSTTKNIAQAMQKVRVILCVFSLLAVLSSLFLIGEVMFLNVVQKKKDYAIMKCFGASSFHVLKTLFFESMEVLLCAQILSFCIYGQFVWLGNTLVKKMMI